MKDTVYAVVSDSTGNCIAICANIEDAWDIQGSYDFRGSGREPQQTYSVKDVSRQEAEALLQRQWVDASTTVELMFTKGTPT